MSLVHFSINIDYIPCGPLINKGNHFRIHEWQKSLSTLGNKRRKLLLRIIEEDSKAKRGRISKNLEVHYRHSEHTR